MAKTDKRKKAVVNVQVQWTLALRVVTHFLVFMCAGAFFGLINQFLSDPFLSLGEHVSNFWRNNAPTFLALVCLMPVFIRDTLTLSNRMAGPICRMRDTIKLLADGKDAPPLTFRNNDMWNDLPQLFNRMTDRLRHAGSTRDAEITAPESSQELVEV